MATMTDTEVLAELEAAGSEQTRKLLRRRGVGENMYGVNYPAFGKLQKKIKTDHALALKLWASGNHDARILALMIADPQQSDSDTLDAWAHDLTNYVLSDALSSYVVTTPLAREKAEQWIKADNEWIEATGWNVLAGLATTDKSLPDSYFEHDLDLIARDLHTSKNRVRHSMNGAVISIGIRSDALEQKAIDVAQRIGKVKVDHGETGCKTPDAIAYIQKVKARRKEKA
jgi:3-methyladenine DNA glycosylase AlkD